FDIPTLCHHEALEPSGACRLCLVEVWPHGWSLDEPGKLVTSCLFPAAFGLVVRTDSERVRQARSIAFELLLARTPRSRELAELAARFGVTRTRFRPTASEDDCILCGLCTRLCEHLGHVAIATVGRGTAKEVAPPLHQPPEACVGCGGCARICPTRTIPMKETPWQREIWGRSFGIVPCEKCGRGHLTREQILFFSARTGLDASYFRLCDECSRQETVGRMAANLMG
ncbi:MAG: hypothetical protein FJ125_08940, partial [Deltaproteobacteria bacterium]|nr:hypothetical protein [Deltaproteobacteria bacterium]